MNQDLERSLSHAGHEDNEDACGRRKRGATAAADRMAGSGSRRCWAVERGEPTEQKLGEGEWCALSLCGVCGLRSVGQQPVNRSRCSKEPGPSRPEFSILSG
jgi:hypothetical protein